MRFFLIILSEFHPNSQGQTEQSGASRESTPGGQTTLATNDNQRDGNEQTEPAEQSGPEGNEQTGPAVNAGMDVFLFIFMSFN
jgi:hypothetical protein